MTRVKVCGITRREDAELAIQLGVHALGMVREPTSPRYAAQIPDWWRELPPFVVRVAVYGPFMGEESPDAFDRFQAISWSEKAPPPHRRIQVLRSPSDEEGNASALLVDAHSDLAYGGTGRTADWEFARKLVSTSRRPVILAGGLTVANVEDAIRLVNPSAVDVSSGVEVAPGVKDPALMSELVRRCLG